MFILSVPGGGGGGGGHSLFLTGGEKLYQITSAQEIWVPFLGEHQSVTVLQNN